MKKKLTHNQRAQFKKKQNIEHVNRYLDRLDPPPETFKFPYHVFILCKDTFRYPYDCPESTTQNCTALENLQMADLKIHKYNIYTITKAEPNQVIVKLDSDFIQNLNEVDGNDFNETYIVPLHFKGCNKCKGSGVIVDPRIDCSGLTAEEFYNPDFNESYMSGNYNITCTLCEGEKVILDETLILATLPHPLVAAVNRWLEDEEDFLQSQLSESRMDC